MSDQLIFPVNDLLESSQGTKQVFEIETDVDFGDEPKLMAPIKAEIMLMAMQGEIHVEVHNLESVAKNTCHRCLLEYSQPIKIDSIAAEFLLDLPEGTADDEDFFLIDKKDGKIDIKELLRQEILLHFPLVSVCSNRCKGLCPKCGINLNKEKCDCKIELKQEKPFAILKQLKQ